MKTRGWKIENGGFVLRLPEMKRTIFAVPALIAGLGLMLAVPAARAAAHFQRLKSFGFPDQMGQNPRAPLLQGSNGVLYGTTYNGGSKDAGTVFRANKDGSGYQVLHHFDGVGEGFPLDGLVQGSDGALYGTTRRNLANATN